MAGTHLNFPYDSEIFNYEWKNTPDLILTSMIESGAVVQDSEIARLISNGSNFFTVPFYDILGGEEEVYNGVDSFTHDELSGKVYSGVVFGRMKAWKAVSFIKDFNSGADPMAQIVAGVAKYWQKKRQERLIGILEAVFGISGDADWDLHTTDLASGTTEVADTNLIGATTINDATVKACGDNAQVFSMAIMHSVVANRLANLQLLEFSKYTDARGITRDLPLGTVNGKIVIVNDNVPVEASGTVVGGKEYTTYVLGLGAIRYAQAPVDVPSEMDRDPKTNGGVDMIYTRVREAIVPAGFSFVGDVTTDVGIPDTELLASASYELAMPAKSIALAKIVTNG
jgi:hypothetical protein